MTIKASNTFITEDRAYRGKNENGEKEIIRTKYHIEVENNVVINVLNEDYFAVEKNSEVFAFYSKKFNK